ncbi:hypothetical protein [Paenisporosarcina sp. TG20]|uniref:hypothetical protein n=1 Tax=Paenisporosarcina sp. TG20 TaxID=1211706 RepID=UPI00030AD9AF|nr:hypothetical protein [Paenisporosarcina sp. TG20]
MNTTMDWLKAQRSSGGYNMTSSMFLRNADANSYVEFFVSRVNREQESDLKVKFDHSGFEIVSNNQIVWFGREVDVDLLRTVKFDLFEEILLKRLERLGIEGSQDTM